ncbi:unnamed protein product [Meloidogyne enterolobii]|uniref:Uncharacterized protein n=1 Tax=Meloidogyne enterolobii TaxID=390850 RepID=A0ACB0YZT2_MELEN
MLGNLMFKRIWVPKKFTGSKRFVSLKRAFTSFTKETKKPKEEPENVKIIYKLPEVIQKIENNSDRKFKEVVDRLKGEINGIRGEVVGIKQLICLHMAITLFHFKLYFDLSQKQQTSDSKLFGEFLSRVN